MSESIVDALLDILSARRPDRVAWRRTGSRPGRTGTRPTDGTCTACPCDVGGERTVANGKLLRWLIRSGVEGYIEAFRGAAKAVIADERQTHHLLVNELETILCGRPRTSTSPAVRKRTGDIPQDRDRGIPLQAVRECARSVHHCLRPRYRSRIRGAIRYTDIGHVVE